MYSKSSSTIFSAHFSTSAFRTSLKYGWSNISCIVIPEILQKNEKNYHFSPWMRFFWRISPEKIIFWTNVCWRWRSKCAWWGRRRPRGRAQIGTWKKKYLNDFKLTNFDAIRVRNVHFRVNFDKIMLKLKLKLCFRPTWYCCLREVGSIGCSGEHLPWRASWGPPWMAYLF